MMPVACAVLVHVVPEQSLQVGSVPRHLSPVLGLEPVVPVLGLVPVVPVLGLVPVVAVTVRGST